MKYDILQTIYGKAAAAENGRAAKLGPMDAPFRGQNALRGMFVVYHISTYHVKSDFYI